MSHAPKQPREEFSTTHWSLIGQALADGTTRRAEAIEAIVDRYRPPLGAHLVLRRRLDQERADEVLQGFITEKILEQYLLRHADRDKGRFRSLLVRSLDNYLTDWIRAQAHHASTDMGEVLDDTPADAADASQAFDIAWARQLLEEVMLVMRAECEVNGQSNIWGVFECRLLAPAFETAEPVSYEEVCLRFGFASPEQASNALVTAKRKFQRSFERVAARYLHDGEQANDLLQELIGILSQSGSLEWRQVGGTGLADRYRTRETVSDFGDSEPAQMARLLNLPEDADELWLREDLIGIMRHQLAQPLGNLDPRIADALTTCSAAGIGTLRELFEHPHPPLALLEATKVYGRRRVRHHEYALPGEVASAIYFASIAAALSRCGQRISASDDSLLRYGFSRVLGQPWVEGALRQLFVQALAGLAN